jgi:hypothetical protein
MTKEEEYRAAALKAQASRLLFADALARARARLSPDRLKADTQAAINRAVQDGRKQARNAVRRHPLAIGLSLAALGAFLFRRPLMALSRRLYVLGQDLFSARSHLEDET